MTRQEVYIEIRQTFGDVPPFFDHVPDASLEATWKIFYQKAKGRVRQSEGALPSYANFK